MRKISKAAARVRWEHKLPFWITACKMRPESGILIGATGHTYEECENVFNDTFDSMVNSFSYYNCSNETGRYPAFYVPEE